MMNTIPSTFKRHSIPYTVIGGKRIGQARKVKTNLSILLLNRGGRLYKANVFKQLEKIGIKEIISIENSTKNSDIELLTKNFPLVRFIMLHKKITPGEKINIGIEESHSRYVLVLWDDMKVPFLSISSRLLARVGKDNLLCVVPTLKNNRGAVVPTIQAPAFYKKHLKIIALAPKEDAMPSIFPYDYSGIYSREKFMLLGGYDSNIINPYWQKLDFGFRSYMWGETICCNTSFRLSYTSEVPEEETTPDKSYRIFFLKNLLVRFSGDAGILPFSGFFSYLMRSGESIAVVLKEFKEIKKWIEINKFRFKQDARGVTELWKVPVS